MNDSFTSERLKAGLGQLMAEKDAEIERLKDELRRVDDIEEWKYLKHIIGRAADVLTKYAEYPIGMVMSVTLRELAVASLKNCWR